jgi:hypothetical protein
MALDLSPADLRLLQDIDDGMVRFAGGKVLNLAIPGAPVDVMKPTRRLREAGLIRLSGTDVLGAYPYELTAEGETVELPGHDADE